jgi:ribosomal protein L31
MKHETKTCDIAHRIHSEKVSTIKIDVIFDHDQNDGKSKLEPYLDEVTIEICSSCHKFMLNERKYIYAYGAMSYNKYTL